MFQSFQSSKTTEGINIDWSTDWWVEAGVNGNLLGLIKVGSSLGEVIERQFGKHQTLSQIF